MTSFNFLENLLNVSVKSLQSVPAEDVVDSGKTKIRSKHYHTFFLHVLLENVCYGIEPNEQNREILFNEVYKRLSESKLLNDSLVLDSLLPLRRNLAEKFLNFVKQVQTNVVPNPTESSITVDSILEESDFSTKLDLPYRYEQNFEQLNFIAKGGFGDVCKVRHKMTDIVYAVKKVTFKYKSDSRYLKVIREAKSIAALNHPNIVSYNNAWIECLPPCEKNDSDESGSKSSSSSSDELEKDKSLDHVPLCAEALQAVIDKENKMPSPAGSLPNRYYQRNKQPVKVLSENFSFNNRTCSSSIGSKEGGDSNDITLSSSENYSQNFPETLNCTEEISSTWDPKSLNVRVMLCIQMEYCDCDLRLWLDRRAEGQELPFDIDIMSIFKDILKGVTHIHSKNIIHRDLKPQNIFFSKANNVLKIGDFGLATLASCATNDRSGTVSNKHSDNLGTIPYAAPEQLKSKSYDSKVDIYSLGIIFIELLKSFSTIMELTMAIEEILKGNFPQEMEKNWPQHIHLVKNMVKRNPAQRMSAKDILNQLQSPESSESSEIVELRVTLAEKEVNLAEKEVTLAEKDEENARLKEELAEKEKEIARLKALLKEQQSIKQ